MSTRKSPPPQQGTEKQRQSITIRFKQSLLEQIDAAAEKEGISRSAWLTLAANEKLRATK